MSVPSYGDDHDRVWRLAGRLLRLCRKLNIDTVAGPVTSGVMVAMACFMRSCKSKYRVRAMLLGKDGYCRAKHGDGPKFMGAGTTKRILIVDDCVSVGDAMVYAIGEIKKHIPYISGAQNAVVVACASKYFCSDVEERIKKLQPDVQIFSLDEM